MDLVYPMWFKRKKSLSCMLSLKLYFQVITNILLIIPVSDLNEKFEGMMEFNSKQLIEIGFN